MAEQTRRTSGMTRLLAVALFLLGSVAITGFYLGEPGVTRESAQAARQVQPDLLTAIKQAESAAQSKIAADLAVWRRKVMERVDTEFLDWHFGYMRRRSADIKWWWQRVTDGKTTADETYLQDTTKIFHEKVMSANKLQAEMEVIAAKAASTYHASLIEGVLQARANSSMDEALFDDTLQRVTLVHSTMPSAPRVTLADLVYEEDPSGPMATAFQAHVTANLLQARRLTPRDLRALPNSAIKVAAIAMLAVKTGTEVATAVKSLGVAKATAGAIGTATAAVVVVAALGAHEWWMHKDYVTTQRPKLRKEIEIALKSFTDETLTENGRFGKGLLDVSNELENSIRGNTIMARLRSRLPNNLRQMLDI